MNYPAASHGVSKARQQYENHLEASFGVWTRGAIMKDRYKFLILTGAFVMAAYFIPNGPARGIGRESKRRIYSC
jgi:hypothetical protein